MTDKTITRRVFMGTAAVAIPVAAIFTSPGAAAQAKDMPKLDPNDPVAKALMYTHDASKVDPAKAPNHKAGQTCANCVQLQAGSGEWRACNAFPREARQREGLVQRLGGEVGLRSCGSGFSRDRG